MRLGWIGSAPALTADERSRHTKLVDALRREVGDAWVGRREALVVLFGSKLQVGEAAKRYKKWVLMLKSYGFASLAEIVGPATASSSSRMWGGAPDLAGALRKDVALYKHIVPAGVE